MPFRLAPLKKRVAHPVREPWKVANEMTLPSLAKGVEAHNIGSWVPSPKTSNNEDSLPQIQEIADRIASRYAGGLNKLNQVQQAWRQKHEALQSKRQHQQGENEAPILTPHDESPVASGSLTARDFREVPVTSSSNVSRRSNSGGPPRRRSKKKSLTPRAKEDVKVEVADTHAPDEDQDDIKDVLKSGLGDLFHQKRDIYGDDLVDLPKQLRRSDSGKEGKALIEDDDHGSNGRASITNSASMEEFQKVKRRDGPRKTLLGGLTAKKNARLTMRPRETSPAENDGERHGRQLSFATCSELAKKHKFTVPIVRHSLEEFLQLDKNGDGRLSLEEFEQAIRDRCNIAAGEATPIHLLNLNWSKADKDNDHEINFEEFLLWSTEHLFTEELVVNDPQERYLRELARKFSLPLDQVERCYKTFMNSDSNRNGFIEEGEFRSCVAMLWNCDMEDIPATRFRQFWMEADKGRLGKLSFEVFLVWYMTIGVR